MNGRLPQTLALTLAFFACLSACGESAHTPEDAVSGASTANASGTSQPKAVEARRSDQALAGDTKVLESTCAGTSFTLTSTPAAEAGMQTALHRIAPDRTPHRIAEPREMTGYAAVGLGCAVATSTGEPYFVVQYGELPSGCSFCEWFYLYDANGGQLTRSESAILVDRSLREAERQSPNNREYEGIAQKLGITHPEIRYVEMGDGRRRL